jgi:RNA polymerase sigma-32 factor
MDLVKNRHLINTTANCSLSAYIQYVNSIPMLTLEEEEELTERFINKMDVAAAQRLILSHLRLVVKIAQTFKTYSLPIQDMISEGNIGLMKAVRKFTPSIGCRLATYASWWIRAAIQEYVLHSFSLLKVSTKAVKQKLFYKLSRTKDAIKKLSENEEENLSQLQVLSLDSQLNDDTQSSLLTCLSNQDKCHVEEIIEKEEKLIQQKLLEKSILCLNDREKDILYRRRLKHSPDKLVDIAKIHNISPERVRQIEQKTIEKLKQSVKNET